MKQTHKKNNSPLKDAVGKAGETVLRQVAKLLVGKVHYAYVEHMLRRLFVEEAEKQVLKRDNKAKAPKSTIALLTGIDSRTISNTLSKKTHNSNEFEEEINSRPEVRVLLKWEKEYKNPLTGEPRVLDCTGTKSEFYKLVSSHKFYGVTPHSILSSLERAGCVELGFKRKTVKLLSTIFTPCKEDEAVLIGVGSDGAGRLLKTAAHNCNPACPDEDRYIQQQRWCSNIPPEKIEQLRLDMRELLEKTLNESEGFLIESEDLSITAGQYEAGIGVYYFETPPINKQ